MSSPPQAPGLDQQSVCDVCKDSFGCSATHPRAPVRLSCGHTFCKLCLARMAETALDRDLYTTLLQCPFRCRGENVIVSATGASDLSLPITGTLDNTLMATLAATGTVLLPVAPPPVAGRGVLTSPTLASRMTQSISRLDAMIAQQQRGVEGENSGQRGVEETRDVEAPPPSDATCAPPPVAESDDVTPDMYAAVFLRVGMLQASATSGTVRRRRRPQHWASGGSDAALPPITLCALCGRGVMAFCAFGVLCAASTLGAFMAVRAPMSAKVLAETTPPSCAVIPMDCFMNGPGNSSCNAGNATWFALARPSFIARYDLPPPSRAATDFPGVSLMLPTFISQMDVASAAAAVVIALTVLAACMSCVPCSNATPLRRLACVRAKAGVSIATALAAGLGMVYSISAVRVFFQSRNTFCSAVCSAYDASIAVNPSAPALCVNLMTPEGDAGGMLGAGNSGLAPAGKLSQNQFDFSSLVFICVLCLVGHLSHAVLQWRKATALYAAVNLLSSTPPQGEQQQQQGL